MFLICAACMISPPAHAVVWGLRYFKVINRLLALIITAIMALANIAMGIGLAITFLGGNIQPYTNTSGNMVEVACATPFFFIIGLVSVGIHIFWREGSDEEENDDSDGDD